MRQAYQTKVLAIIASCTTPAHLECANRMLANVKAPKALIDALQVRRVELIATPDNVDIAARIEEIELKLDQAEQQSVRAMLMQNALMAEAWLNTVLKCRRELKVLNSLFDITE